jgi:hypothetical protein
MTDSEREEKLAVYTAVTARRVSFDSMVWQVPILSFTAQAFLLSIALNPDSSEFARIASASVSVVVSLICVFLMGRHRQADVADAHALERMEQHLPDEYHQHGEAWRLRRNATVTDDNWIGRAVPMLPQYILWVLVLYGLAALGVVVGLLAIFEPSIFAPAAVKP